jgi:hypothetical protein
VYVRATTKRTGFLRLINEKSESTLHLLRIIPLAISARNPTSFGVIMDLSLMRGSPALP